MRTFIKAVLVPGLAVNTVSACKKSKDKDYAGLFKNVLPALFYR